MLLPALGKARDKAMLINCMSRHKEVNRVIRLYNMDFNDWFCVLCGRFEKNGSIIGANSKPYIQFETLYGIKRNSKIYYCPADSVTRNDQYTILMTTAIGYNTVFKWLNAREIEKVHGVTPSRAVLTAESDHSESAAVTLYTNGSIHVYPNNQSANNTYFGRHGYTSAFSFLDGRVISIRNSAPANISTFYTTMLDQEAKRYGKKF